MLLLAACDKPESGVYQGYAEGEYVRAAPIDGGTIDAIPVKRGDRVADGALLFQLDQTSEVAAHQQAVANLASANATLVKTGFDFDRVQALVARGNSSKSDLDAARAARDAATAAVQASQAALAQADWRLTRREGRAAKGGTVDNVYFRVGEYAAPGQPVVSVLPPENIKVR
ncbi:MAG TPA: biotin/lipoyl-binding protein, partial [Parvibaculum sp.]